MNPTSPRITFGVIVLNGEPFTRYNLRSLYPWAHQIIVVEGACRTAKATATPDGHSIDGTVESLRRFQAEEDPESKVMVVSACDEGFKDGFWPEKTEMCQAFAKRATGNYLWQIDSDEFYREEDMPIIFRFLSQGIGWVTFPQYSFWGGMDYINNSMVLAEFDLRGTGARLFAWGKGYQYAKHRPPTVIDENARDVRVQGALSCRHLKKMGIYRYHYCLVFPSQVLAKVSYYGANSQEKDRQGGGFSSTILAWHELNFKQISRPFHLHNVPGGLSWIHPFSGTHPRQVVNMMADIREGLVSQKLRQTSDIESLMRSNSYRLATCALDVAVALCASAIGYPFFRVCRATLNRFKKAMGWFNRRVSS
jgi:hypothetical protein